MVVTGLDQLAQTDFATRSGPPFGVLVNQASITRDCRHVLEVLKSPRLAAIFGPQHGLFGHTQDNMIEWEGEGRVYSLYGAHREPTDEMLAGLELMVVDLPDIGSRYYTFAWTMALMMKACERKGIPVLVLDRPNPIDGVTVEGPILDPTYASFVGLHPLPIRHAMTLGELARHFRDLYYPSVTLTVVDVQGWDRKDRFRQTGLPWAMPSPNMPTPETALVYPGGCLLEGTQLSEGRGTTRPFEIFGAPYLSRVELERELNALRLPGVVFRGIEFQPTFHKFSGEVCSGCFVHVADEDAFRPVQTYADIIWTCARLSAGKFEWRQPPYEYEYEKMPMDLLWGSPALRTAVDRGERLVL